MLNGLAADSAKNLIKTLCENDTTQFLGNIWIWIRWLIYDIWYRSFSINLILAVECANGFHQTFPIFIVQSWEMLRKPN